MILTLIPTLIAVWRSRMADYTTLRALLPKNPPKLGVVTKWTHHLATIVDYDRPEPSKLHRSLADAIGLCDDCNNGYQRQDDCFTDDALRRYVTADRVYYAATGRNMQIHSGTRTVGRQAQLYIEYKWHKIGNLAEFPGCSFHNWGVAADMIRVDESNVIASMQRGGWRQTVAGEPWHFECVDSPDHARASEEIANLRTNNTGLAYQWSEQVSHFYLKSREREDRRVEYQKRFGVYQGRSRQLQAEADRLNQGWIAFDGRQSKYKEDVADYEEAVACSRQLYDEIIEMSDRTERHEKIRKCKDVAAWIEEESRYLQDEYGTIESEGSALDRQTEESNQRIESHNHETVWLEREYEVLEKLADEIEAHEANSINLLQQIENAVATALQAHARMRITASAPRCSCPVSPISRKTRVSG